MGERTLHPIDMPHDDLASFKGFDEQMRARLAARVAEAYAAGRWRSSEDILFDPADPDFIAYWAQKCRDPITEPMKGSGLEDHFRPFRKVHFDLAPAGFDETGRWRLSAVGDLMPAAHVAESGGWLYRGVADLVFGADCAYANLECTVVPDNLREAGDFAVGETPIMNVSEDEYRVLTRHEVRSFDVLQLANNHALDDGEEGISNTLAMLERDGITPLGVYSSAATSARPTVTAIGDLTIGWVAHTFSVNGKPLPEGKPWMVDITPFHVEHAPDYTRILDQVTAARAAGCEIVIVCLHWGAEWEFFPLPVQLEWAHAIAEAGADAIIGTHPHVIQPIEIHRPRSDRRRQVPILYSLGNLTPTMGADYTTLSLVANLTLSRGRLEGQERACVTSLDLTPVAFMGEAENGRHHAASLMLRDIVTSRLDPATRAYADGMSRYADLILGPDWRNGADEGLRRPRDSLGTSQ